MDNYKTAAAPADAEITVERSRFIAALVHVESEEEATEFIARKKAEYHDARHNCSAYILKDGTVRYSDDGEPHSTAGKPMADVLSGSGLVDVCVVVTRYFGGVLLGTGGLVRAYSSAVKEALAVTQTAVMQRCAEYSVTCSYSDYDYMQKNLLRFGRVLASDFGADVTINVAIRLSCEDEFLSTVEKLFMGRYTLEKKGEKILSAD